MNYTITEEQIKELSKWKHGKRLTQEWFPEVFETKVEVGKWYKRPNGNFLFIKSIKNTGVYGYGFDVFGYWVNCTDESSLAFICDLEILKHLDKATHEEVESALIAEAKKRGFVEGAKFKSSISENGEIRTVRESNSFGFIFCFDYNQLTTSTSKSEWEDGWSSQSNPTIFKNGIWASIIKEKSLSKSEAEAKLTELINDGNTYKIN